MSFSRVVGMKAPGLNSLFVGLNIKFSNNIQNNQINWKVTRHTNERSFIILEVSGNGVKGQLNTMYRNKAISQPDINNIFKIHGSTELKNKTVLIIGGSRGLGDIVPKYRFKGGHLIYYNGKEDAINIKNEIINKGLKCSVFEMNVMKPDEVLIKLKEKGYIISDLYYFYVSKLKSKLKLNKILLIL